MALFPGSPAWPGARRELLHFMVQGKINRGRHTNHPAKRHSIWTNQCPPPSPIFYRPDALAAVQPTVSKHWRQYITIQDGWFLRPDCAPSSERPRASIAARRRATGSIRISRWPSCCYSSAIAGIAIGANFKIYQSISSISFLQIESNFFTIHRRHRCKKRWTRILKFDFPDVWDFLKFSKRRHVVPLRPIWTIMVAAKLDHSRVLVTKFHQNQSTLMGRSVGQRQTDTHTAENKGPSGLQLGQQT